MEIQFVWKHGGGHVLIAGSFNQWQASPLELVNGFWQDTFFLNPGSYQYKFIVDGVWKYDHQKAIIDDGHGNVNNFITLGDIKAPVVPSQRPDNKKSEPLPKPHPKPEQQAKPQPKPEQQPKAKPVQDNKAKPDDNKASQDKGKPEDKKKGESQPKQGKPQDNKGKPGKDNKEQKKVEVDPARLVGHWEKIQVNTITGKESWWVYVKTDDDPAKFPLRRRIPPDCVSCGSKVLVEDEVFSRYGVEWQPLCIKCYSNGSNVPLINGKLKPSSKPVCYWCLETEGVINDICTPCQEYVSRQQTNFCIPKNEALTTLYYFQTGLRNSRKSLLQN